MHRRLLPLVLLLACSTSLFAQLPLQLMTTDGQIVGTAVDDTVRVYRGLPYAAPPVGANRWRPPQPVAEWSGLRDATRFAPRCVQGGFAPGADQPLTSEDCLYLNVWSPAESVDAALPVVVWIHGGGFFTGAGSADIYDGSNLASKGAVVVTFNYRLGTFGFLAHPELTAESPHGSSGNYAMLDMIAVLEWVYDNIAAFGGDPGIVTIVGESAGSEAVATLMASPLSAGLFHRAIMQSGAWMGLATGAQPTLAELEVQGQEQVEAFGASSIAELREASAQQIFENFPTGGSINVDGWFLPRDTSLVFDDVAQHPVDVLAGSNRDEGIFFGPGPQSADEFRTYASDKFGALASRFLSLYPADSDAQAAQSWLKAFSDELAWQMRRAGKYQADRGLSAWLYYFTHVPPGQEARGATHVAELAYMFNQHEQNAGWMADDRELADAMSSYWVNFATRGNPNRDGVPPWPAYRDNTPGSVQILDTPIMTESTMVPSADALEFFEAAYQQHLDRLESR